MLLQSTVCVGIEMRTDKQNKKIRTYGFTAVLAMLAILIGVSVSASMEQFAAPTLSLTDPYYSIVDDATGVEDGDDMGVESEDGLRGRMAKMIRHRMPEQMQEHEERNSTACSICGVPNSRARLSSVVRYRTVWISQPSE